MSDQEVTSIVLQVALDCYNKGPGWSQEGVVLRAIGDKMASDRDTWPDLSTQQRILNAWHDLFLQKRLAWGYDLDNPNSPFYHVR